MYQATLHDATGQAHTTGRARFFLSQDRGVFWPETPTHQKLILKQAATVHTSEGDAIPIFNLTRHPALGSRFHECAPMP